MRVRLNTINVKTYHSSKVVKRHCIKQSFTVDLNFVFIMYLVLFSCIALCFILDDLKQFCNKQRNFPNLILAQPPPKMAMSENFTFDMKACCDVIWLAASQIQVNCLSSEPRECDRTPKRCRLRRQLSRI